MISHFFEERFLWRSYCSRQPSLREVLSMLAVALILAAAFLAFGTDWSTPLLEGLNSPRSVLDKIMGGGASQEGVEIWAAEKEAASTAACTTATNPHEAHLIALAAAYLPEEVRVAGAPCVRLLGATADPSRQGPWSVRYLITGDCAEATADSDVVGRFHCVAAGSIRMESQLALWSWSDAGVISGAYEQATFAPSGFAWECDCSVDAAPIPSAAR